MKKNKRNYWILTGAISAFMLFSAYYTGTHKTEFDQRLGFPDYFRIELTTAKIIGAVLLLIPRVTIRIREWIYVGFGICLISAIIAKVNSDYPVSSILEPMFTFALMLAAAFCLNKMNKVKGQNL